MGSQGLLLTGTSRDKKARCQVALLGRLNRRGSGQISGEEKRARV